MVISHWCSETTTTPKTQPQVTCLGIRPTCKNFYSNQKLLRNRDSSIKSNTYCNAASRQPLPSLCFMTCPSDFLRKKTEKTNSCSYWMTLKTKNNYFTSHCYPLHQQQKQLKTTCQIALPYLTIVIICHQHQQLSPALFYRYQGRSHPRRVTRIKRRPVTLQGSKTQQAQPDYRSLSVAAVYSVPLRPASTMTSEVKTRTIKIQKIPLRGSVEFSLTTALTTGRRCHCCFRLPQLSAAKRQLLSGRRHSCRCRRRLRCPQPLRRCHLQEQLRLACFILQQHQVFYSHRRCYFSLIFALMVKIHHYFSGLVP